MTSSSACSSVNRKKIPEIQKDKTDGDFLDVSGTWRMNERDK